jgi:lipopolysaccharide/colanic/teichoic acid biosynthesis glycosyltransferase/glycosyltransferase involved in cell wall biosynthesis
MRIAMIGIKAIPARFGGFETAVDEISRGVVRLGHPVTVYNRASMSHHAGRFYEGVELVKLPTIPSKNLSTICHAFLSTLHVMFRRIDVVHYFTTGATLFAPLPRLMGKKIVCSVDGTDWQRAKWGRLARWYLRFSERLAVRFCHGLISDSREVMNYYRQNYGVASSCIAYGMRQHQSAETGAPAYSTLRRFGLQRRDYILFVGRLVPENNVHHLIQAFEKIKTEKKLVIVGDDPWERDYVRSLKSTRDPRIIFTGGVYGEGYAQLQQNAYLFVLPDEVGGTHPALVEAMGFGNCVLVNDTPSNLEVIASAGFSYRGQDGADDLQRRLQMLLEATASVEEYRQKASQRAREHYRWEDVVGQHVLLYRQLLSSGSTLTDARAAVTSAAPAAELSPDRSPYWSSPARLAAKRLLDVSVSASLLAVLSPCLLALAVLVKLTSPGPVLYHWRVVGQGGCRFVGYKFRSMVADADARKPQLLPQNEMTGPVFKLTRDPRITPLGTWMRRYSLDELPQVYSVLAGDMSLVGPRPPLETEFVQFTSFQKQKLAVKPGITCLWQVKGRNRVHDFDDWVRLDLDYIRTWSLSLDLKILMRTVGEVLRGSGK